MKILYDRDTDTLTIVFSDTAVSESDEVRPGYILDWDEAGNLVSIEILNASEHLGSPAEIRFSLEKKPELPA